MNTRPGIARSIRDFYTHRKYDYPLLFWIARVLYSLLRLALLVLLLGFIYFVCVKLMTSTPTKLSPIVLDTDTAVTRTDSQTPLAVTSTDPSPLDTSIVIENATFRDKYTSIELPQSNSTASESATTIGDVITAKTTPSQNPEADLNPLSNLPAKQSQVAYPRIQWTNVRQLPTSTARIVVSLSTDTEVKIIHDAGEWVAVEIPTKPGIRGYVYRKLLQPKSSI